MDKDFPISIVRSLKATNLSHQAEWLQSSLSEIGMCSKYQRVEERGGQALPTSNFMYVTYLRVHVYPTRQSGYRDSLESLGCSATLKEEAR